MEDFVTPVGYLLWVRISGEGKQNYNEDGYDYTASVLFPKGSEEANGLIEKIHAFYEDNKTGNKTRKSWPYRYCDAEGKVKDEMGTPHDEDSGTHVVFNFKTETTWKKTGKQKKIGVYNADAQKIALGDKMIGNGSEGAISGKITYYNRKTDGVSLWLNSIQLCEFVEYSGDAGFEKQEGSFQQVEDEESGFTPQVQEDKPEEDNKAEPFKTAKPKL